MLPARGWPGAKARQWGTRRCRLAVSRRAPWGGGRCSPVRDQGQPTAVLERQADLTAMEASPAGPTHLLIPEAALAWPCNISGEAEGSCPPQAWWLTSSGACSILFLTLLSCGGPHRLCWESQTGCQVALFPAHSPSLATASHLRIRPRLLPGSMLPPSGLAAPPRFLASSPAPAPTWDCRLPQSCLRSEGNWSHGAQKSKSVFPTNLQGVLAHELVLTEPPFTYLQNGHRVTSLEGFGEA